MTIHLPKAYKLNHLISYYGLTQVKNEPTHLLSNFSSCIDLIFTNQPNLITHSGVHFSLHKNCQHQIMFARFDYALNIHHPRSL